MLTFLGIFLCPSFMDAAVRVVLGVKILDKFQGFTDYKGRYSFPIHIANL